MRNDLLAPLKLLGCALLLSACTSTLDFDAVSAGGSSSDDGFDEAAARAFTCDDHLDSAFCDDFEGPGFTENWARILAPEGMDVGSLDRDDNSSLSGERSLLAIMNAGLSGDYVAVTALKDFEDFTSDDTPYVMQVDFDMRVEVTDATAEDRYATVFQVLLGENDQSGLNQLVLSLGSRGTDVGSWFREGEAKNGVYVDDSRDFKSVPTIGDWTHVSFTLEVNNQTGSGNRVKLVVSGVKLFDAELTYPLNAGGPRMELGVPWVKGDGGDEAWRLRFENVLVNFSEK
jgi:hypothetical protein